MNIKLNRETVLDIIKRGRTRDEILNIINALIQAEYVGGRRLNTKQNIERMVELGKIKRSPIHNREQLNSIVDSMKPGVRVDYRKMGSTINHKRKSSYRETPRIRRKIVEIPLHQISDEYIYSCQNPSTGV